MRELFKNRAFLPFVFILFLNATVDLAHKITIQNVLIKSFDGDLLIVLSALINALILLPFILLFSPSGYLNDRFSKTVIVRFGALSAVGITLLITLSYYNGWFFVAFGMTLLLAIQSAIYSPAKYGLIKKIVGAEKLGSANGVVQAVTIVAILLSSLLFSVLFELSYAHLHSPDEILRSIAPIGWILVLLSALEAYLAYRLPVYKPSPTTDSFSFKKYLKLTYLKANMKILLNDKNIWLSIVGLSLFWGISQLVIATFPAHYKAMSGDDNAIIIQAILAASAIGLVIGSLVASSRSKYHIDLGVVPVGAVGLFISLVFFSISEGAVTMALSSLMFGFFGALLIVPLNASIQFLAHPEQMGRVLAGNNFIQNISMVLFLLFSIVLVQIGLSTMQMFFIASAITLVGSLYAIIKLPHFFTSLLTVPILKSRYKFRVKGLENLPQQGGVLLLGNHVSWIDWLVLQLVLPRAITFVMHKDYYELWYVRWFFKLFKAIPIASGSSRNAISSIKQRLDRGEVVVLFPEGHISYNGELGEFARGYELSIRGSDHPIVPFYLKGLWGSSFSRASKEFKKTSRTGIKREILVTFGKPLDANTTAQELKQKVYELSKSTSQVS